MAKDRLLVYSYFFYPHENANTNVVMPILEELCKSYDVDIFTCDMDGNLPATECYRGMTLLRFRLTPMEKAISRTFGVFDKDVKDINPPHIPIKQVTWRFMHKLFTRPKLERLLTEYPVRKPLVCALNNRRYKAFITLSAPIEPQRDALALAQAGRLTIPWFAYFTDPHATFIGLTERYDRLMEKEMEIYNTANAIFTTPELYEDNSRHPLGKYRGKTIPVAYANLRPIRPLARPSYLPEDKINCVYAGSLFNSRVRNPEYFYQMMQACDERFQFHIACNSMDGYNRALKKKFVDTNPNVVWHENAPMDECLNMMCWADVLVNLGNRCTNQTPSKIFDYLSTGKPIVNVHPLENDTAKCYLERYPLALNIMEKETPETGDANRFIDFCLAHRGENIPFEQVREWYADMTPASVAARFAKEIERPRA